MRDDTPPQAAPRGPAPARPEAEPLRAIEIDVLSPPPGPEAMLILPRPLPFWGQRFHRIDVEGVAALSEVGGANTRCRAFLARPAGEAPIRLRYEFGFDDAPAPDWVWETQTNRYTTAAPSLVELAQRLAEGATSQSVALSRIVGDAAGIFGYAHVEEPFNQGCDEVPMICGTTKGSCVEINTYIQAAALSLGLRSQYFIGYWFHPEKTETPDAHCWLAFQPDDRDGPVFWDLAHCLKWGPSLGAKVAEGLNPAGGRRMAMSCGRGLAFDTPFGRAEISHFSEPMWVTPGQDRAASVAKSELRIRVEDPNGDRAQRPIGVADAPRAA